MRISEAAATWVVGVTMIAALAAPAVAQRGRGGPVELPEGPVRRVILDSCTACHGLGEYALRAMDRDGWQSLLVSMIEKGAIISDESSEILLDYLVANFGPDTARSEEVVVVDPEADAAGREILEAGCTSCHNLQRVEGQRQVEQTWRNIVVDMNSKGAGLTDDEVDLVVGYLGRNFGPSQ